MRSCDYRECRVAGRWCRCERLFFAVLAVLVLLIAFGAKSYKGEGTMLSLLVPVAKADTWDDAVSDDCPPGTEYRGYHRTIVRCPACRAAGGQSIPWQVSSNGCRGCGNCSDGSSYYRVCPGQEGWPVPACVTAPADEEEERDDERLGDLFAALGGSQAAGGNPWSTGPDQSFSPLGLFGEGIGAVQSDDVVPQVETSPGSGEFACPGGTTLITSGDDEGMCAISDQCVFYGAAGGTWPDCVCSSPDDARGQDNPAGWFWDSYALRCMPREGADASIPVLAGTGSGSNRSYLWSLMCRNDTNAGWTRGYVSAEQYLTQSSPVFAVRQGGVEVLRYNSVATLTINLGTSDYFLSSDEESDELSFGSVVCAWLAVPMSSVEGAFSGFTIRRAATRCPAIVVPFFNQSIRLDVHCFLIGRWLGVIQALCVVAYSFLGAAFIWERNTGWVQNAVRG